MSRQRVARNALFSVTQVVLSALALLGTYWLMMRALSIEEIGLWSLVVGSTLVARLSEMGLGAGVLRFVAWDLARGRAHRAAQTIGMAALAVLGLVSLLALLLRPVLASYLAHLVPPHLAGATDDLLSAALIGVVLGAVGNVFTSALDGAQRMDIRAFVQVSGSLIQIILTGLALPRFGVVGLGWVQVAQTGLILVIAAGAVLWQIGQPPHAYFGLDRVRLRELVTYGGGLQVSAIAQLLFEPLLKVLLAGFSGLALTGYFDMANRIIVQFRSLIVAAYGALVPHVAARSGEGALEPEQVRAIYREAFALLLFALLPYFAVVASALPLALTLWKGQFDPTFLQVALIQFAAWSINLTVLPAYLLFVGLGRLRWTILSHIVTGLIMVAAGGIAGALFGGFGVLLAGALALISGSLVVLIAFRREFGLNGSGGPNAAQWRGIGLLVTAFAASLAVSLSAQRPGWGLLIGLPAVCSVLAVVSAWFNPLRAAVVGQIRATFTRI